MLKRNIKLLGILLVMFLLLSGFSSDKPSVYVIPVNGEINTATYKFIKDSTNSLDLKADDIVIFEIDTYGGLISEAIKIKDLIISLESKTVAYVNNKAISAGVLITIASENIYMANSATIGSAETIPNEEKVLSMWRSVLRDTAEYRGRDPLIVEAMADTDVVIDGIVEKDKLLNLTSQEALNLKFIDNVAANVEEVVKHLEIDNSNIIYLKENFMTKVAKNIASASFSGMLLSMAFMGLIIEIMTPGFGVFGMMSIISFALYFGANIFAGYANVFALILFIIGVILAAVAFSIPGFGFPEVGSVIFLVSGIVLANKSVTTALISLSAALIISILLTYLLIKFGFKNSRLNKLVLASEHQEERGYLASHNKDKYLNKEGITLTELRPSGFAMIDNERVDVLSREGLIERDVEVIVEKIEGLQVFVRRK